MTIALQGDWGTGKTSFMNAIRKGLEPDNNASNGESNPDKIQTIFFNTWEYSRFQSSEDMYASFVIRIVGELGKRDKTIKEAAQSLLQNIMMTTLSVGTELVRYYIENATPAKPLLKLFEKMPKPKSGEGESLRERMAQNPINTLHSGLSTSLSDAIHRQEEAAIRISNLKKQFARLIQQSARKYGRVVIFVDDLDRLTPQTAVEFLEVLKLFLDVPDCVFVLAVDYDVVVSGLNSKFKDVLSTEKTRSFFDKIIQLPFQMPVGSYKIDKMLKNMFASKTGNYASAVITFCKETLGANPRTMKRLYNAYELQTLVYQAQQEEKAKRQQEEKSKQQQGNQDEQSRTLDAYTSALLLLSLIVHLKSSDEYLAILDADEEADWTQKQPKDSQGIELRQNLLVALEAIDTAKALTEGTKKALTKTVNDFLGVASELSTLTTYGSTSATKSEKIKEIQLPGYLATPSPKEPDWLPELPLKSPVSAAIAMTLTFQRILGCYLGENPTKEQKNLVEKFINNSTFLSKKSRTGGQFKQNKELILSGFPPVYLATKNNTVTKDGKRPKQEYVASLCQYMRDNQMTINGTLIEERSIFWETDVTRLYCYPVSVEPLDNPQK